MYNHITCESKWIKQWEETRLNQFRFTNANKKYYILDMFPYPSASGLHIGHARSYTISDIIARYKKHCGFNVLHPIGWDAFGLPAEQFAIANNKNPRSFNEQNINIFRQQLKSLGFYYDYDYEINTSDPKYYQWTQWIFCQLVKNNLAHLKEVDVNWCEQLGTVLANDEIIIKNDKMFSERGNYPVIKKKQKQWVIDITKYAARLAKDLEPLTWDDSIKLPQQQWIGLSSGCLVKFKTTNSVDIHVYTTRPDTIYGVGFIAIAPENKLIDKITASTHTHEVKEYITRAKEKTELQRKEDKNKTGVFTGTYAINPCNEQRIPIYVADYVLNDYATGMIMGVPAHDQRDYDFAIKYQLPIVKVIDNSFDSCAYEGDGKHVNSPLINGLNIKEATKKIINYLIENKIGSEQQQTKLHDWIFSRQRYWGEPFPILFTNKDEYVVADLKDLPIVLPELDDYRPDHSGLPPLARAHAWSKVLINNKQYTRELSTMPGSAGSSWYFLAYLMKNPDGSYLPIDSKEAIERFNKWMPVDLYVGGNEHATGHCLYARFWHKFLHDLKLTKHPEPFTRCIDHGIILGPDGNRMSKSKGNVINPIDIINTHGADALRLYSAFIGPINGTFPWNPNGLDGMRKWLERVYRLFDGAISINDKVSKDTIRAYHTFVKNVTQYMEEFKLNLVVSQMMIFTNHCYETKNISKLMLSSLVIILSCFSPFIAEELWHNNLGNKDSVVTQPWPTYDEKLTQVAEITLPIQINGKLKATIKVAIDTSEQEVVALAKQEQHISELLKGKIKKVIYIKNKILNFII